MIEMECCRECGMDGEVLYCSTCKQFCFPMFNSTISTIIFNLTKRSDFNVLVTGHITNDDK